MAYSSAQVMAAAGVTYRQLDHWVTKGWLGAGLAGSGTGHRRQFTDDQFRRALVMGKLIRAGFRLDVASAVAAAIVGTVRVLEQPVPVSMPLAGGDVEVSVVVPGAETEAVSA
jgi:MerR HTH family regulatory protein